MRNFKNVNSARQKFLLKELSWLHAVHELESVDGIKKLSLSYFDHWLTREEAELALENVPILEQNKRDAIHKGFTTVLAKNTELLHFIFRGRKKNTPIFRSFSNREHLQKYLSPRSLGGARSRLYQIVLPEYCAVLYEGYDDTSHLYFSDLQVVKPLLEIATESGLHVLKHG